MRHSGSARTGSALTRGSLSIAASCAPHRVAHAGEPVVALILTKYELRTVVLVLLASALGALLSRLHSRLILPTVVVEIVLGIVIGPQVLGIARVFSFVAILANFGLAMLFFFAGLEVIEKRVAPGAVRRGTVGWAISLAIGLGVGGLLQAQAGPSLLL